MADSPVEIVQRWFAAYPEDVFPSPTQDELDAVIAAYPQFTTRLCAYMARHVTSKILAELNGESYE